MELAFQQSFHCFPVEGITNSSSYGIKICFLPTSSYWSWFSNLELHSTIIFWQPFNFLKAISILPPPKPPVLVSSTPGYKYFWFLINFSSHDIVWVSFYPGCSFYTCLFSISDLPSHPPYPPPQVRPGPLSACSRNPGVYIARIPLPPPFPLGERPPCPPLCSGAITPMCPRCMWSWMRFWSEVSLLLLQKLLNRICFSCCNLCPVLVFFDTFQVV